MTAFTDGGGTTKYKYNGLNELESMTEPGASTATTAGLGNPILSIIEDVIAVVGVVVAFVAPFLGAALAVVLTIVALFCIRGIVIALRRSNSTVAPGPLT